MFGAALSSKTCYPRVESRPPGHHVQDLSAASEAAVAEPRTRMNRAKLEGSETILVVEEEDDPTLLCRFFRLGYNVMEAGTRGLLPLNGTRGLSTSW